MIKTTILQNFKIIFVRIKPLNTSFPVQYRYVPLSYIDNDYPYYLVEQRSSFHVLYTVQCHTVPFMYICTDTSGTSQCILHHIVCSTL